MRVELINTGTELLLGEVLNTHLRFLAQELFPLGLRLERQVTVPDGAAIRVALEEAFARAEIVLVTGGLGPTTDDLTREIVAELLGRALAEDAAVLAQIQQRFQRGGWQWAERVRRQAQVPAGAEVLANAHGTAPGLYFPAGADHPHLFLLPGPPRELHPMFREAVRPRLQALVPPASIGRRVFRVVGLGESRVEEKVGASLLALPELELGYCARLGEVDVRCLGPAETLRQAEEIMQAQLGSYLLTGDSSSLEAEVVAQLKAAGATLAVAESCTGGLLASRLTDVPGASAVFLTGLVTYANTAKMAQLGVSPALLETEGAVSEAVAAAMAEGARRVAGADYALATTGIAGPDGGSEAKPVGTIFLALASARGTQVKRRFFPTDRETFKIHATSSALDWLRQELATAK